MLSHYKVHTIFTPMACLATNVSMGLIQPRPAKINTHGILPPSPRLSTASKSAHLPRICSSPSFVKETEQNLSRRSGNYPPAHWSLDFIQSLQNDFTGVKYVERRNLLVERVGKMLDSEEADFLGQLELINELQRFGVSYHFKDKIMCVLRLRFDRFMAGSEDLYETALGFRLMRQHGFVVSQDVFDSFKDEKGNFADNLSKDTKGMLELYEASYLLTENESGLESAREFAAKNLNSEMGIISDKELGLKVQHALELPLHWRVPRVEARWYIDLCEKRLSNKNLVLLELAKLDYNIVQQIHQEELKDSARWWESTCLGKKLSFIRDRLVVCVFWSVGKNFEPGFEYLRMMETKVNCFLTAVDDIYDVYGTLDELQLFTQAVERWDMKEMENLPDYMKLCYLAIFNSVNEMAFDSFKKRGFNPITYLRKVWADYCNSGLKEAKWYYSGYTPTLEEYMDNGWISITVPVTLVHAYFMADCPVTDESSLQGFLHPFHNIIRYAGMIVRLADDLETSPEELKRGDVPKAMQCYMIETGASEEEAREYIRFLIGENWKKLNEERLHSPLPPVFLEIAMNLARVSQCVYEYGDGHGHTNAQTKDRVQAMFFTPIDPSMENV